eukprot:TRINITY_DN48117_c0_g1_i1.p1 TRINITY_DN48117_c0_g1~~TRINITY_DN48117_c0_g1_i1.p1  ORF type:complete len:471 (-),score=45.75 TRINITY_DN48117_c0_g1_i1:618-2030(-)
MNDPEHRGRPMHRVASGFRRDRPPAFDDPEFPWEQTGAAVRIQSAWRGHVERKDFDYRSNRAKPWGFYTHSLGLKFNANQRDHQPERMSLKMQLHLILEDPSSGPLAQVVSLAIMVTVALSILGFILETLPAVYRSSPIGWLALEVFCTFMFSLEYTCRFISCDQAGLSYWAFILSPMNMIDLLAVTPFFVELLLRACGIHDSPALRALRVIRLIRLARMFKLGRYAAGMRLMGQALLNSMQAISVLIFLLAMGVTVFSSAMYTVERLFCPNRELMSATDIAVYSSECANNFNRGVSPSFGICCNEDGKPNDFPSIVAASWWSAVTMTSVGYGDVYPKTALGKCIGVIAMLVGMVLIALPVAIVGQKFQDVYESNDMLEAKSRGNSRFRKPGEVWTLMPSGDEDPPTRLRSLQVKDPALAATVKELASSIDLTWECRERIGRGRACLAAKEDSIRDEVDLLLCGLETFAS